MSAEDRAVFLWRLERLYESESRQRLIQLAGGRNEFIQKILLNQDKVKKSCPTGKWMFTGSDLKDLDEMDIGELLVIINNTDLKEKVEQDWKSCFYIVKSVRNLLAHKGQVFGVDEKKYEEYLKKLKDCLNVLKVDPVKIEAYLISTNITNREKEELKEHQVKSLQITRKLFTDEMKKAFAIFTDFNIGRYLSILESRDIINNQERSYIDHKITSMEKNMEFLALFKNKKMDILKSFVDYMNKETDEAFAESLKEYFWD